jgi:hypothetical protein
MKDRIEVGDIVHVDFNCSQYTLSHEAEVLYKPLGIGDSWHFKDIKTGQIHYVSEGCTISKLRSHEE